MLEERLTERLRFSNRGLYRREVQDPKRMVDSVIRHLERILNTRRGSAQIADDFGIPDFTDFKSSYPDSHRELERAIRHTIQKYEPRLKAVRVRFMVSEDELLSVSFQIVARLILDDQKELVVLDSVLDADGKIQIR